MQVRAVPVLLGVVSIMASTGFGQTLPESHFPNGIPVAHPRLWWSTGRLALAQQWYAAHPFEPSSRTDVDHYDSNPLDNAFKYLLTGQTSYCDVAKTWALAALQEIPLTGATGCNECRWYAGEIILVYDWCHDALPAADRTTIANTMNAMNTHWNADYWGGPEPSFAESNFFWGYLRNSLTWGIASYGENALAGGSIDHAMDLRWDGVVLPHMRNRNPRGVFEEGSDYGHYMVNYILASLVTSRLLGRDMLRETDYYRWALFNIIYNTVPAPTYRDPSTSTPTFGQFPYGDAQDFVRNVGDYWETGPAQRVDLAEFVKTMAAEYDGTDLAAYARRWISVTAQGVPGLYVHHAIAAPDAGSAERAFSNLPLDYYAGGPSIAHAYARTGWGSLDTVVHMQLVSPPVVGHEHSDTGNWQIWRNSRWLAVEAPGRTMSGFLVPAYGGASGTTDVVEATAHSTLMFAGQGLASSGAGVAQVTRLESRPDYFYAATNMTDAYHSADDDARYGNPSVGHAEREFLFIRPLETLVVLDRMQSVGADTRKGFLVHAQGPLVAAGANSHSAVNVDQVLRVTTVAPASPAFRAIDERSTLLPFPYRLEVETSGTGVQHFLHVVQVRDTSGQDLAIDTSEDGTGYTLTLSHPSLGCARVRLEKGVTSGGGAVGYAVSCSAIATRPLTTSIQGIEVTDSGPVWTPGAAAPTLSIGSASVVEGGGAAASGR